MINTLTGQFDHVFSDPEEREFLGEVVETALEDVKEAKVEYEAESGSVSTVEEYVNHVGKMDRKIEFLEMLIDCLERR